MKDKKAAKLIIKRAKMHPEYYTKEEVRFAKMLRKRLKQEEKQQGIIFGFETIAITVLDIIAAMITGRPYQEPTNLFDALELTKSLIVDDYPQEFKLIVNYFKQFFKN